MSDAAHLTAISTLTDLRASLCTFAEEARGALEAVDLEIRRTFDWLEEQLANWHKEVRRAEDEVFHAQQELARRRLMRVGDRPLDCTDQERALRRAKARLEHAQQKHQATRSWLRNLPTETTDYEGPSRQVKNLIDAALPRACALLERKLDTLAEYLALRAPGAPPTESKPP